MAADAAPPSYPQQPADGRVELAPADDLAGSRYAKADPGL